MSNYLKDNKELMREYNFEKNKDTSLDNLLIGSGKKIWWICNKGHEYEMVVYHRRDGHGCPYCSNQKVLKGYNDLETTNPELSKEWDYEKNYPLKPSDVIAGTEKKFWWKCSKEHSWEQAPGVRMTGSGCPYCANRKVLSGYNDLETTNPELAKEWNYEKNYPLLPSEIISGSHKKLWWKCSKDHEWQQAPGVRITGVGCPYCANKKVLIGYNDLKTSNPRLAKEWNYEKNKFGPETVTEYSNKKVWWKCDKEHEWEAAINSRTAGNNCPLCSIGARISFPEKAIYYYVKKIYNDAIENYRDSLLNNKELDIYIPSKKIGIEYDGDFWHDDEMKDKEKDLICKKNNIKLIRIREPKCKKINTSICLMLKNRSLKELEIAIKFLTNNILKENLEINMEQDKNKIYELMSLLEKKNSLSVQKPDLVKEWDYERNYPLLPSQVGCASNKKVWWICSQCGYNWETRIAHRSNGHNCPKCSNNLSKKIEQFSMEMEFIREYKSIAEAKRITKIYHIDDVLAGKRETAGGYIWKYKEEAR